jgi:hypothetical protein
MTDARDDAGTSASAGAFPTYLFRTVTRSDNDVRGVWPLTDGVASAAGFSEVPLVSPPSAEGDRLRLMLTDGADSVGGGDDTPLTAAMFATGALGQSRRMTRAGRDAGATRFGVGWDGVWG